MSDFSDMEEDLNVDGSIDGSQPDAKKHAREQHNALERRRRDNIKDMYSSLREVVPDPNSERSSRAVILKKAIDAIQSGQSENIQLSNELNEVERQNAQLREEIARLKAQKEQK